MTDTLAPATLAIKPAPAALVTKENAAMFVNIYFSSQRETDKGSKLINSDINTYYIFWAIRILVETSKYDSDDFEFHMKKNPIFATDQIELLRQAIQTYPQKHIEANRLKHLILIGSKL